MNHFFVIIVALTLTVTALGGTSSGAPEHVSIATQDGGIVFADVYGSGERGVILAHGGRFTKESWALQAQTLAQAGYRVLAFDFRGFGQSPRVPKDAAPPLDVLAAVRYLRQSGAKTVAVIGGSFGGGAAADATIAAAPGEIDRLVLLGTGGGDGPTEKLKGRLLFIVGRDDTSGDGLRLPGIRGQYEKAPQPKKLVLIESSAHAQFLFATKHSDHVMREILQFLSAR
ncbi:MAG TPA: alpha/beta fold hydrolase [Blastocatellia bacterium]|nr:alpha/beta fold hydrolase [Blastocatellia bacterium]